MGDWVEILVVDGTAGLRELEGRLSWDLGVVFLRLDEATVVRNIQKIEALSERGLMEVVLCHERPEAADLEILLWKKAKGKLGHRPPLTQDELLKVAWKKELFPPGHRRRLLNGECFGVRTARLPVGCGIEEWLRQVVGVRAAEAYVACPDDWPHWAKHAAVLKAVPSARLVLPMGTYLSRRGRRAVKWRKKVFERGICPGEAPKGHLLPLRQDGAPTGRGTPVAAVDGLLQVRLEGAEERYAWIPLLHHCGAGFARLMGCFGKASLPVEEMENALLRPTQVKGWESAPALTRVPFGCRLKVFVDHGLEISVETKRLDSWAHSSWLGKIPLLGRVLGKALGGKGVLGAEARRILSCYVRSLESPGSSKRGGMRWFVVPGGALYLARRCGNALGWVPSLLLPGEEVSLVKGAAAGHLDMRQGKRIWLGQVEVNREDFPLRGCLGLVREPETLQWLSTRWPGIGRAVSGRAPGERFYEDQGRGGVGEALAAARRKSSASDGSVKLRVIRSLHPLLYELGWPGVDGKGGEKNGMPETKAEKKEGE